MSENEDKEFIEAMWACISECEIYVNDGRERDKEYFAALNKAINPFANR